MAAVAHQRSPTKFAPADWHTANFVIASSSERQRTTAHDVRQQSQRLRNDTGRVCGWGVCVGGGWEEINKLSSMARSHRDTWKLQLISTNTPCPSQHTHTHTENKTRWTQHSTDTKLGQRIGDIHSWRETLEKTLQDTETEINTVPPSFSLPLSFLSLHPFS